MGNKGATSCIIYNHSINNEKKQKNTVIYIYSQHKHTFKNDQRNMQLLYPVTLGIISFKKELYIYIVFIYSIWISSECNIFITDILKAVAAYKHNVGGCEIRYGINKHE